MNNLEIKVLVKELTIFGSVKLDISDEDFQKAGFEFGDVVDITYDNGYEVKNAPYLSGFYVERSAPLIVSYPKDPNPTICYNYVSMSARSEVRVGDMVTIRLVSKGDYRSIDEALCCQYTNNRDEYDSDDIFANFRAIDGGDIAPNRLYRSASPFEPTIGRNIYAASLCEKSKINSVLNLSDSMDRLAGYLQERDEISHPYSKALIRDGRVISCPMKLDYTTKEYQSALIEALERLSEFDGPYLIHCMEGKDRAGFVCALIEMLMGYSFEEVIADYMVTYFNYFGLNKNTDTFKYDELVKINIFDMIAEIVGMSMAEKDQLGYKDAYAKIEAMDMAEKAYEYLLDIGMDKNKIDELKNRLSK